MLAPQLTTPLGRLLHREDLDGFFYITSKRSTLVKSYSRKKWARQHLSKFPNTNTPESGLFSSLAARGCLLSDKLISRRGSIWKF